MEFSAGKHHFLLDGKPFFLYSGEVQYFRIAREFWKTHLAKLKAAGANTVSTYIPWSWHEVEEGRFDFSGETDPQRDLLGFLDEAKAAGLYVSVKPGPYILAEFEDRGIPEWFLAKHPEVLAQGVDVVAYLHPVFLEYTRKWYDAVMPHLARRQITHDGNIILMQVCNEVGLFNWLGSAGDTGKVGMAYFGKFLKQKFKTINRLNAVYGKKYRAFESVEVPRKPAETPAEYVRWNDWQEFHRWYYAEYLSLLIGEIKRRGIEIQLFHNIPGWVYSRGTEYPVNISFYSEIVKRHPELILGVDHIPENPNYRNFHDDLIINEMTRALQGGNNPIWAAEQQAGTREHHVHTFPNEMELFYKACFGRGMTGMNFYMFSQGMNPERRGAFGPTFYWMTALGHDGREKPLYPVIRKLGRIAQAFGPELAQTRKQAGQAVLWYRPYYHDEFYYPLFGGVPKIDYAKIGLRYDPKTLRNTYYFEGVLKMLASQNREFEIVDPQAMDLDPKRWPKLWVVAADTMDRKTQNALAEYVENGGHLILCPGFPERDLQWKSCSILRTRLGIKEGKPARLSGMAKIDLLDIKDINALSPVRTYSAAGAREIARTPDGKCCGLLHKVGKGSVAVLGTAFGYNIKEHLWAFEKLCDLHPVPRDVEVNNPAVQAHVRYGKDFAFLTLLNYTPVVQDVHPVVLRVPELGEVRLPAPIRLEPLSGLIFPLNLPLGGAPVRLLWTTAEILEVRTQMGEVTFLIQPSSGAETELCLRRVEPRREPEANWNGQSVHFSVSGDMVRVRIPQGGKAGELSVRI